MIFVFPDTNLFAQCKPLSELDWSLWAEPEITLVVCYPVVAEIDAHKNKGADRLAKRARTTVSIFKAAMNAPEKYLEICRSPLVRLVVRGELKPDIELSDTLSYSERDHQFVGIAAAFTKSNAGARVTVLSDDMGALGAAQLAEVDHTGIPSSWLLSPESDYRDKRINALEQDLLRYQKSEPKIDVAVDGAPVNKTPLAIVEKVFEPLTRQQLDWSVAELARLSPMSSDFGPAGGGSPPGPTSVTHSWVFSSASDEEISEYRTKKYPNWLVRCREFLENLHVGMLEREPPSSMTVVLTNVGSRPAESTLISFSAEGKFGLRRLPSEIAEFDVLRVPPPPRPPRGEWTKKSIFAYRDPFASQGTFASMRPMHDSISPFFPTRREPDGFYWKSDRSLIPMKRLALECEQWRHGKEGHDVAFIIAWSETESQVSGAIRVEVNAANMTDSLIKIVPIQLVR